MEEAYRAFVDSGDTLSAVRAATGSSGTGTRTGFNFGGVGRVGAAAAVAIELLNPVSPGENKTVA